MIAQNLKLVLQDIQTTLNQLKRPLDSAKLIAVSKTKPASDILEAFQAGQIDFGENYIQEWREKSTELNTIHPLNWHIIGHIQTNKLKYIAGKVHLIHTIDRLELAKALDQICIKQKITQNVLLQVKLASEDSKFGCDPDQVEHLLKNMNSLANIRVCGLMTIGSLTENTEQTRSEYRSLRKLQDDLNQKSLYHSPLSELSMGMSADYKIALEEGATLIRVGSQIFGSRPKKEMS